MYALEESVALRALISASSTEGAGDERSITMRTTLTGVVSDSLAEDFVGAAMIEK